MCACDEGPRMCSEHRAEALEHDEDERTEYEDDKYGDFRDDPSQGWLGP